MKLNWKACKLAMIAAALGAGVGCGGLNGSYNVSPASFLLPGLGKVTPVSTNAPNSTVTFASVVQ